MPQRASQCVAAGRPIVPQPHSLTAVGMTEVWSQYGHKDQSQPAVRIPTPAAVLWETL